MKHFLLLFSLVLCLFSCKPKEAGKPDLLTTKPEVKLKTLTPERELSAGFLAINGVYNSELIAPYDILQHTIFHHKPGIKTFIVSPTKAPITTFEGIEITPHYSFEDCPPIDILIVPSAEHNMDTDLEDETLINFVKERGEKAQYVMSLCDGAFVLAKAGLLDGLKCTTFPKDIAKFRETFPHLDVKENVSFVHDGKAITSAGGAKSYDPALYLSELFYGKKKAQGIASGLVIDWHLSDIKHIRPKSN